MLVQWCGLNPMARIRSKPKFPTHPRNSLGFSGSKSSEELFRAVETREPETLCRASPNPNSEP